MRWNFTFAIAGLCVGLVGGGCTTTYPVRIDRQTAVVQSTSGSQERVIHIDELRKGDDLTATLQSGAVKHFKLMSHDAHTLTGKRLVLGIGGIERLEVRRNNVLYAAGNVTRVLGEFLVLGAADSVVRENQPRVDHPW